MRWALAGLAGLVMSHLVACGSVAPGVPDASVGQSDDGGVASLPVDGGTDAGALSDAGSPDAGTPGCDRPAQVRTADIALLDRFRSDVANATTGAQLQALTESFFADVATHGGTPLVSPGGTRVAFIARDAPQIQYSVGGTFNGWTAGVDVLSRVGQSNVYAVERTVPRDGPHAYKMVDGSTWYEDRRARHVVEDGIAREGPGEFNALVHPALGDASKGRLVAWRGVRSERLNDARDVFIYVPAAYDDPTCPTLPSLYFHDGNESLTRAPFRIPADQTYRAYPGEAAVLVFVALPAQDVRMSQYSFGGASKGDDYLAFLRDELRPRVEGGFRLCPGARDRGLAGASLGGLISGYGAFRYPEVWGYVGSQSGSYFWENDAMIQMVASSPRKPIRWYLDHGCPDDNCDENRALAAELTQKGYPLRHVEEQGGLHQWPYWQGRLPGLLLYFREGLQGCE